MIKSRFFEIGGSLVRPVVGLLEVAAIATNPGRSRVVDHRLVGVTVCEVKSCDSRHVGVALVDDTSFRSAPQAGRYER